MTLSPSLLTALLGVCMLSSCSLPRNHSELMRGNQVRGDVPLYMPGGLWDFFRAGLILPGSGGYARAEYDVMDIGEDGNVVSSSGREGVKTVAQVAIPSSIASFDLSRTSIEMRGAVPATKKERAAQSPAAAQPAETPMLAAAPKVLPLPSLSVMPVVETPKLADAPIAQPLPPQPVVPVVEVTPTPRIAAVAVPTVSLRPPRSSRALLANRYLQAGPATRPQTSAKRVASVRKTPLLPDAQGHHSSPVRGVPPSSARWISNPHFQVVSAVQ